MPAVVPGGVHESLVAAGLLEHPFFAENEPAARWVEDRTWWYRARLTPVPGRTRLVFDALDGIATVWLNDVLLGEHRNQHRPASWDVASLLRPDNVLLVRFVPTLASLLGPGEVEANAEEQYRKRVAIMPVPVRPDLEEVAVRLGRARLRKATCSWGWDLAARVASVGIQGPVSLVPAREELRVHARTTLLDLDAGTATLRLDVSGPAVVRVSDPAGAVVASAELQEAGSTDLVLTDAQPWWTHDLGAQPLYTVTASQGGEVRSVLRIGLRTVALDRSPDPEGGRLFRLVLNGVPLFTRGANWVPASQLVGSVTDDTCRGLVALAQHGEMNVLRVWGGGVYERDAFYDACDEHGLLVWQDFMFACDDYPAVEGLTEEVRLEAVHQVRRLRHHACLALWCGNNEVQGLHQLVEGTLEPGDWGWTFFHELLPAVVAEHDPGAVYWPGSPWGEEPSESVNGVLDGDRHAWEVWHGGDYGAGAPPTGASRADAVHFRRYADDRGRFISEMGLHASPELATLRRWTRPGTLALRNDVFDHRNKDRPKDKGYALMEHETGVPTTLEDYVDFSMACQAEGLKLGVEHYRRRQPLCSGTLVWQLNDSWPGLSWSVIDHDLVPKAGYWFLQRAYRPVLASFRSTDAGLELWVTNSGRTPATVHLDISLEGFDGRREVGGALEVHAPPSSSAVVWSAAVRPTADQVAWVSAPDGSIEPNRVFFAPLRELPLTGTVSTRRLSDDAVELTSTGYSYFTRVVDARGVTVGGDYLDLRDGERRVVPLRGGLDGDVRAVTWASRLSLR